MARGLVAWPIGQLNFNGRFQTTTTTPTMCMKIYRNFFSLVIVNKFIVYILFAYY